MAVQLILSNNLRRQTSPFRIPAAVAFPRAQVDYDDERPRHVLLFSGLAQIVIGVALLITLYKQLEYILATVILISCWMMITGIVGICAACFVTSKPLDMQLSDRSKHRQVLIFQSYIALLLVGGSLSIAAIVHAFFTAAEEDDNETAKNAVLEQWKPGITC